MKQQSPSRCHPPDGCCCCRATCRAIAAQAVLGKARALEATGEQQAAWRLLSEAALQQHCAVPVLLEELARFALAQQDWEGLAEVLGHLQEQDDSNALAAAYQGMRLAACRVQL